MEKFVKNSDYLKIISLSEIKSKIEFDFTDKDQYNTIVSLNQKCFSNNDYPGLEKILKQKKDFQNSNLNNIPTSVESNDVEEFQNAFEIISLSTDQVSKIITSNAIGTMSGGYQILSLILNIVDENNNLIAHASTKEPAGKVLEIKTLPIGGGSTNLNCSAHLFYNGLDNNNKAFSGLVKKVWKTPEDPKITQPVSFCTNPFKKDCINIGLGRPWSDNELGTRLDYVWNEENNSQPIGKIPFVGSVEFNAPISSPLKLNDNLLIDISVVNTTAGGQTILSPEDINNVFNCFSIDPSNNKKLNWDLPAGKNSTSPGNPIVFSKIKWPTDMEAMFLCTIYVKLVNEKWCIAQVTSSNQPDSDPLDGNLEIKPISFIWHCLIEGTKITLADGSEKNIENITNKDKLIDKEGNIVNIDYTLKGIHYGKIIDITTEDGLNIKSTSEHIFMKINNKPIPAKELKKGDILISKNQRKKIVSITTSNSNSQLFYNIALSKSDSNKINTFLANGFIVGDAKAQSIYQKLQKDNINWVKNHVSHFLHKDVESYFKEKFQKKFNQLEKAL